MALSGSPLALVSASSAAALFGLMALFDFRRLLTGLGKRAQLISQRPEVRACGLLTRRLDLCTDGDSCRVGEVVDVVEVAR
ncbi:hypothetical protein ACWD33_18525 [Streptomyces xiamenensis]|uniref:hypothetical protein n=1 Tax=Streptomyces xiamenensis TaxID=408015 RepID=UPI0035D82CAE